MCFFIHISQKKHPRVAAGLGVITLIVLIVLFGGTCINLL
jgi:heme/copper-type cytochrome/quinol oxidase subunit 4